MGKSLMCCFLTHGVVDAPAHKLPTCGLDKSQIRSLAEWVTHGLDSSWSSQVIKLSTPRLV